MRLTGLRRSGALKLLWQLAQLRDAPVYECSRGEWRMMRWSDSSV